VRRGIVIGSVVAAVAAPGVAAPAMQARSVAVPLLAPHEGDVASGLMTLHVRVPHGAQPSPPVERTSSVVTFRRGRCLVTVALSGVLSKPSAAGVLDRPSGPDATLIDTAGARRRVAVSRSRVVFPKRRNRAPVVDATLRLPPDVLVGFPWRDLTLVAYMPVADASCRRDQIASALERAVRDVVLRITGAYAPDDPAPLVDVEDLPALTIDAPRPYNRRHPITTADTDGDGSPELGLLVMKRPRALSELLVNLRTLDGHLTITDPAVATLTIHHVSADHEIAHQISPAGDLDGDGLADFLIATPRDRPWAGSGIAVIRGRRGGGRIDARDPREAWLTVGSSEDCRTERSVEWGAVDPGDMDGDGRPDLVIAADHCAIPGHRFARTFWLVRGGTSGTVIPGADDRTVLLARAPFGVGATELSEVGDVNGDGLADLAISDHSGHWAAVLFGSRSRRSRPLVVPRPDRNMLVVRSRDCDRLRVPDRKVGDVNGDGRDDLIVDGSITCGRGEDGGVVVFGTPVGRSLVLGEVARQGAGLAVDRRLLPARGDRNGDGLADLLARRRRGEQSAYVVFGRPSPGTIEVRTLGDGGRRYVPPPVPGPVVWRNVFGVRDVDGDGRPELGFLIIHPSGRRGDVETVTILGSRAG